MTDTRLYGGQEVIGVDRIEGPIVFVKGTANVGYDEVVEIRDGSGRMRRGRVLEVGEGMAVVQVFAGSTGLSIDGTSIRVMGETLKIPVAEEMLGRIFDGLGSPLDGGPQPLADRYADVNGQPINPTARVYPSDYIQTGISAIDGMNTLLRGQKLPIFSGAGMPHDQIAAQIVRQATLGTTAGEEATTSDQFAIVFAAIFVVIGVVYYAMVHSYIIVGGVREKELKVVNRVLGLLLLAIGVQFIITGIKAAFL